jgi:hypothetical protein
LLRAWAFFALVVIVVTGCAGGVGRIGRIGELEPDDILAASLARVETSAAVHVEATFGGSVNAGALSSLAGRLPIGLLGTLKLDGASATSDVDITGRAVRVSVSLPVLFGATAEVILTGGDLYTKVNLLGDKFAKSKAPSWPPLPRALAGATFGFAEAVDQVRPLLETAGATATMAARDRVGGRETYRLVVTMTADGLNRILASAGVTVSLPAFRIGPIDYWVYADTLQPARLRLTVTSTTIGSVAIDLVFSAYDQPVSIAAPPADQVKGG